MNIYIQLLFMLLNQLEPTSQNVATIDCFGGGTIFAHVSYWGRSWTGIVPNIVAWKEGSEPGTHHPIDVDWVGVYSFQVPLPCAESVQFYWAETYPECKTISSSTSPTYRGKANFINKPKNIPEIFAWAKGTRSSLMSFKVDEIKANCDGFDYVITRTDTPDGWNQPITFCWALKFPDRFEDAALDATDLNIVDDKLDGCNFIGFSLTTSPTKGNIAFADSFETAPRVSAWARDQSGCFSCQYKVDIDKVDSVGFNYTVTPIDTSDARASLSGQTKLFWTATRSGNIEKSETFGDEWKDEAMNIPPITWFSTPAILEICKDKFTVLGREIHMSKVHKLFRNVTKGIYRFEQTSNENLFELTIRGDIIYLDDNINFQSLKKLEIYARKFVSNGNSLLLTAPACNDLGKATHGSDGENGKSGIDSTVVAVYVNDFVGNLKIVTQASDGCKGQNGGDGVKGKDGRISNTEFQTLSLSDALRCAFCNLNYPCFSINDTFTKFVEMLKRANGEKGGDGNKAGLSGDGGKATKVSFYFVSREGEISLERLAGRGGQPAEHGYGGKGGGEERGVYTLTKGFPYVPFFYEGDLECSAVDISQPGDDGFLVNSIPQWGRDGIVEESVVNKVESLKSWLKDDIDLLRIILRRGESLFLRNKRHDARDNFAFVKSVTDEDSEMNQQASFQLNVTTQGFDYYGNTKEYAPDEEWSYYHHRVAILMETGKLFETTYNEVMNRINEMSQVHEIVKSIVTVSNRKAKQQLVDEKWVLQNKKHLYLKALRKLESNMNFSMIEIKRKVEKTIIKKSKISYNDVSNIMDFFIALTGCVLNIGEGNVFGAVKAAQSAKKMLDIIMKYEQKCKVPTLRDASATLEKRLIFGYEYKDLGPENMDFSKMDVSAVPVIMKSNLGRNKGKLAQELSCLLNGNNNLNIQIENFFRDADLRITQIDRLININVKVKSISLQLKMLQELQDAVSAHLESETSSKALSIKMQFTDLLFSLHQQQEATIMSSLYELSKAYQFVSLWNFDIMGKYVNYFGDRVMTSQLGSLNGMFHLQSILQSLENDRNSFLRHVSSSAGPASHTFNAVWKFDKNTNPVTFKSLYETGQFTVQLEVDPNDNRVAGCDNCYNGRLISMYIELIGEFQAEEVPSTVYLRVAHLGDSRFLLPCKEGTRKMIVQFTQTPEDVAGGNVMKFDFKHSVKSKIDPTLGKLLDENENKFCQNTNNQRDFFGGRACKSPYATYTVVVPKGDHECSLNADDWVSGSNCKGLDLTKFDAVHVYARIKSWSSYVSQDHFAYSMRSQPTHQLCAVFRKCPLMSFA